MAAQPRLFLFYGTDSRTSYEALRRWQQAFVEKYGDATKYVIDCDEMSSDDWVARLTQVLQSNTLFAAPTFVVLKRIVSSEKGNANAGSKALVQAIERLKDSLSDQLTVALWESRDIPDTHPLKKQFLAWKKERFSELKQFSIPTDREVQTYAARYVEARGGEVEKSALMWLAKTYAEMGKQARLEKRLKYGQELMEDERGWWLQQFLDTAMMRAAGRPITLAAVQKLESNVPEAAGVFDVLRAIEERRWVEAHRLLSVAATDASFTYSFLAALKWQSGQQRSPFHNLKGYLDELIAEAELIAKNFTVMPEWVLSLLIERIRERSEGKKAGSLLPYRKLWLAHLLRS